MGCTVSQLDDDPYFAQKQLDSSLSQQLQLQRVGSSQPQFKMLLLGPGESGKLTVLKQMKLLHKGGFLVQERRQYTQVIWVDVIQLMRQLIIMGRKLGIPLDCDKPNSPLKEHKRVVLRLDPLAHVDTVMAGGHNFLNDYVIKYLAERKQRRVMELTGQPKPWGDGEEDTTMPLLPQAPVESDLRGAIADAIAALWAHDSGIRQCFHRLNEFQLLTLADYYFANIARFVDPGYLCLDTDILMGRVKTTGITETDFQLRLFTFKVLDAGGQRLERRKWLHYFDGITVVLYVMAVLEYDQMLFEDEQVNRAHELLVLFDTLCNLEWFWDTPFIIFLNKVDLLEKKLPKLPIKNYFPDYNGRPDNVDDVCTFFEQKLRRLNRTNKQLYVHRTMATDTEGMKFVINAITDLVIQDSFRSLGLI